MESDMHRHGITAIPDFPASATSLTGIDNIDAQRHDLRTAAYVETAIRLQQSHGTSCALEYLQANDVDPVTSGRVLTHPERRRHSL
ncbi:hypothetical protein Undi14_05260 [Undibacterium sp. 14-3-2]|uniref:hypothetical protein n=1 Tax=Undibacterium sp. 14-3-2 TaxID=2800129 RepID=UPI001906D173|nr:hypothetical protein [Undibacterium sp. 14-3-2]MBK1889434.1 hypothetical protein [Undibacterium sp. 14-3-2]